MHYAFIDYLGPVECRVIHRLLDAVTALGGHGCIFDDYAEEWGNRKDCTKLAQEVGAAQTTTIRFFFPSGNNGVVWLVHGNGEDVISDYTQGCPELEVVIAYSGHDEYERPEPAREAILKDRLTAALNDLIEVMPEEVKS